MGIDFYLMSTASQKYIAKEQQITEEELDYIYAHPSINVQGTYYYDEKSGSPVYIKIEYTPVPQAEENKYPDAKEMPIFLSRNADFSVSLSNADILLDFLGMPGKEYGSLNPNEMLSKIQQAEHRLNNREQHQGEVIRETEDTGRQWSELQQGPRVINMGLDTQRVRTYLDRLEALCTLAVSEMRKFLSMGIRNPILITWS